MPLWEEAAIAHGAGSSARYRASEWLHDGKRFVCVSDATGAERLEIRDASGDAEPIVLGDIDLGRVVELAASPTADVVAVSNHRHELLIVDLDERRARTIDRSPASHVRDLAFSPDGRWIAYSCAVPPDAMSTANADTAIVRIAKMKSGAVHDVTPLLRVDRGPAWDPEGNYLYFISTRDFNPVYDALQFDLSFPQASRPFVVTLRDDVPNPFVPKPAPVHKGRQGRRRAATSAARTRSRRASTSISTASAAASWGFRSTKANTSRSWRRAAACSSRSFRCAASSRRARAGTTTTTRGTLLAYDFEQQRCAPFAHDVARHPPRRRRTHARVHVARTHARDRRARRLARRRTGRSENAVRTRVAAAAGSISRARASRSIRAPNGCRCTTKRGACSASSSGTKRCRASIGISCANAMPRSCRSCARAAELSDVMWEMLGELGTSHAYEIGGDHRAPRAVPARVSRRRSRAGTAKDGYDIAKIYRGDSWNRDIDSPLAEPGLADSRRRRRSSRSAGAR